jgi:hypothetical protein
LQEGAAEKVYAYVRIFAPARFRDKVAFQWEYDDPKEGWIPLGTPFVTTLLGGKENGYRTYGSMTGYKAGAFCVHVLTGDGREIGRKTFEIVLAQDVSSRAMGEDKD